MNGNFSYFFMISAEDNSGSVMEVLSSTQVYYDNIQIYPNPSSAFAHHFSPKYPA